MLSYDDIWKILKSFDFNQAAIVDFFLRLPNAPQKQFREIKGRDKNIHDDAKVDAYEARS